MKKTICMIWMIGLLLTLFAACGRIEPNYEEIDTVSSFTGTVVSPIRNGCITVEVCDEYKYILGDTVRVALPDGGKNSVIREREEIRITVESYERTKPLTVNARFAIMVNDISYMDKPILYFYPEAETKCSVKVNLANGYLSCTYPEHGEDGWQNFIARPDGTLIFPDGKEYYCLYWEALAQMECDYSQGFCVKGSDTAAFLTDVLPKLGLNAREANEFIIYWLPQLQNNPYNLISFQTEAYTSVAGLEITPTPDSLLRVYMAAKPLTSYVEIEPQHFDGFARNGFTVVEWGGHIEK